MRDEEILSLRPGAAAGFTAKQGQLTDSGERGQLAGS